MRSASKILATLNPAILPTSTVEFQEAVGEDGAAEMRCEEVKALLNDLIDGELDEERKAAVEAHIRSCAECAREKRRLERVVSLVRGLPREKVPVDLLPSLRASRVGVGLRRLVAGLATVAAALLVAILIMPLLKEGVVTEKAAKPFVGPPPVAPEAVAKKSPPAAHAKTNKEAEKKSALQTGRVAAEDTEPYEGKKLHPPEKEKELAKLKQDSAREGWHRRAPPGGAKQRSGVEKREAVAAAPEPASPPARPAPAEKPCDGSSEWSDQAQRKTIPNHLPHGGADKGRADRPRREPEAAMYPPGSWLQAIPGPPAQANNRQRGPPRRTRHWGPWLELV